MAARRYRTHRLEGWAVRPIGNDGSICECRLSGVFQKGARCGASPLGSYL